MPRLPAGTAPFFGGLLMGGTGTPAAMLSLDVLL